MKGEHSLVPEEVVAGKGEVSWPEATANSSSSGGDSGDRSGDDTSGHDEESESWIRVRLSGAVTLCPRP
jgi:hypothetical protein